MQEPQKPLQGTGLIALHEAILIIVTQVHPPRPDPETG